MEEYKSNSHKSKERQAENLPAKKIEKVVTGEVTTRKKSGIQKLASLLISEDVSDVRSYILTDVLMPFAKNAISDFVASGLDAVWDSVDTALWGKSGRNRKKQAASTVSYRSYYDSKGSVRRDSTERAKPRGTYNYNEIVLSNRGEAEEVLSRMEELISNYGLCSVSDMYELAGMTGNYTDNYYGWTDLRGTEVLRVREGYILKLPRVVPLD